MRKKIAEITLAPGNSSFYDDVSKVLLNINKKTANVYADTNIAGLLNAVRDGRIKVVSGSLNPGTIITKGDDFPAYIRIVKAMRKAGKSVVIAEEVPEEQIVQEKAPEKEIQVQSEIGDNECEKSEAKKSKKSRTKKKAKAKEVIISEEE